MQRIFFFIQGMVEKSDSISFDLISQARILEDELAQAEILIVAKYVNREHYPTSVFLWDDFLISGRHPRRGDVIIYHYCDGWQECEEKCRYYFDQGVFTILRWHNNTPPWFFIEHQEWTENTLRGLNSIGRLADQGIWTFAVNSEFTKRQLLALVSPSRPHSAVVYPATSHLFREASKRGDGLFKAEVSNSRKTTFLFVGRVVPHKSHHLVIYLAHLCNVHFGCEHEVIFVGRSNDGAYLDDLFDYAAKVNVKLSYLGEVDNDDLVQAYKRADFFVCFSQHEGFGLPVYEAMTYGLPVVASLTSAFHELLENHPLCGEGLDFPEYIKKIEMFKESMEFREKVFNAQKKVLSRYTINLVSSQLLSLVKGARVDQPKEKAASLLADDLSPDFFCRSFHRERQYITRSDLKVFNFYLDKLAPPSFDRMIKGKWIYLDNHLMSTPLRKLMNSDGSLEIQILPGIYEEGSDPVLFGPYLSLAAGLYLCEICATVSTVEPQSPDFSMASDIFSLEQGSVSRNAFRVGSDNLSPSIHCFKWSGLGLCEYRIFLAGNVRSSLTIRLNWIGIKLLGK